MPPEPLSLATGKGQAWALVSPPCLVSNSVLHCYLPNCHQFLPRSRLTLLHPLLFRYHEYSIYACRPAVDAWDCLQLNHLRYMSRIHPDSNINWQHRSVETTESLVAYWHEHSTTVNQPPLSPCLARQSPLGMKRTFQTGHVTSWCIKLHHMTWHDMIWHDMTWHDMIWHDMMISYHRISIIHHPYPLLFLFPYHPLAFPAGHPATRLLHPAAECKGNCGPRQCVWRRSTNLRRSRASLCTVWSSRDPLVKCGELMMWKLCEFQVELLNMLQNVTNIHGKSRWNLSTMFRHYWSLELSTVHCTFLPACWKVTKGPLPAEPQLNAIQLSVNKSMVDAWRHIAHHKSSYITDHHKPSKTIINHQKPS